MDYPKHLDEKIRIEVAKSYLKHEMKKMFWRLSDDDYKKIENNIDKWDKSPSFLFPRDFWNGFHGISMGFKLKNLINFVTAENIKWTREDVLVNNLWFGVELDKVTTVAGAGRQPASKVAKFFDKKENIKLKEERLAYIRTIRSGGPKRDDDPIVVIEKLEDNKQLMWSTHDGNGRLARAILNNQKKINAYVGRYQTDEKKPNNYWLPTSFMMDYLNYIYQAIDEKDEKVFMTQTAALKNILEDNIYWKKEFIDRALTQKADKRERILKEMGII